MNICKPRLIELRHKIWQTNSEELPINHVVNLNKERHKECKWELTTVNQGLHREVDPKPHLNLMLDDYQNIQW